MLCLHLHKKNNNNTKISKKITDSKMLQAIYEMAYFKIGQINIFFAHFIIYMPEISRPFCKMRNLNN